MHTRPYRYSVEPWNERKVYCIQHLKNGAQVSISLLLHAITVTVQSNNNVSEFSYLTRFSGAGELRVPATAHLIY